MYTFMSKVANKAYKRVDPKATNDENSIILLILFRKSDHIKGIIQHNLTETAEQTKQRVLKDYIESSRESNKWFYLASSHNDCAEDHKPYQGKMYYDEKAPADIVSYAKNKGLKSIQWVMGDPAWFITRPNCRHFFKSLSEYTVKEYGLRELQRKYKTHSKEGHRSLATPKKVAIEEYEDRLQMLRLMYNKHKTEHLRREISKTELLIRKWKNKV